MLSKYYSALILVSACFFFGPYVQAHVLDYGALQTTLEVREQEIVLHTEVPQSISYGSYYESSTPADLFQREFETGFSIAQDETPCTFTLTDFDNSDPDRSYFEGVYTCSASIQSIEELVIQNSIFRDNFTNYDHYVNVRVGANQWELVFTPKAINYPEQVQAILEESLYDRLSVITKRFIVLGVTHIWTGYDHLLFLLSLLILVRSIRKILVLVTAFTVAHSITLILAGLDIVTVPSSIIEPVIALTIGYVALQNFLILKKDGVYAEHHMQWFVVFLFGLIHGLGFAQILRETSIPDDFFISSLVLFNVGIEIGQLLILAILVPILYKIDTSPHRKKILLTLTVITGAVALFWFIERIGALL